LKWLEPKAPFSPSPPFWISPNFSGTTIFSAFPGGFSYGDHIGSGQVFGNLVKQNPEVLSWRNFVQEKKLIIGICNGFQVLVKMGLLPNLEGKWLPEVSLIHNRSGQFIDQWVKVNHNPECDSVWTKNMSVGDLPIRHGEGRFVVRDQNILKQIEEQNL
jgi:phosphoribosylformylglycinamidine (FGAM) synthase-like amidotransferase family enzyme